MAALDRTHMEMVLAANRIFAVMDEPNTALQQFPLAMDKWLSLVLNKWSESLLD
jgi:hypothetical protein